ncbi:MAG: 2Fe-2S iron-sulfur cluster binding domain-containing protein [Xanthomonadales bacterium]|jgi:2Fe-2S ferredoxin|nr:2Fe-2S iron-sulfur cluster binding domain-containing protein [Xanthomonadales bacterium]
MGKILVTDRAGEKHDIEIAVGDHIMDPLRELDNGIEALCGGMCSCATCHVFIGSEWSDKIEAAQDDELELLEETECYRKDESRLSCQIEFREELDGINLIIAPEE